VRVPSTARAQYDTAWETDFIGGNANIELKFVEY
jgi:hypothetical protein